MKMAIDLRVCRDCGRVLEPCEVCNCVQPVPGMPRDGLRAKCPAFVCRSSYRMKNYIVCGGRKTQCPTRDERNEHYRRHCCEAWQACELYKG